MHSDLPMYERPERVRRLGATEIRYEQFLDSGEGPCPACGEPWRATPAANYKGRNYRITHAKGCDYMAWLNEPEHN